MSEAQTQTTLTPKQLAAELGVDPKVLRSYLRKNHSRDAEVKGQAWVIPAEAADAAREKFSKNQAQA